MSFVKKITSQIKERYVNGIISLVNDKTKAQAFFNYIPIDSTIGNYYFRDEDSNIIFYITFTGIKTSSTSGYFSMTIGDETNTQIISYDKDNDTLTTSGSPISFAGVIDSIHTFSNYYVFNSSYGAALYDLQIWEQNRLQSILDRIVSKMTSYKGYIDKLCLRFTEQRDVPHTITMGTNFTKSTDAITMWGQFCSIYENHTRNSNFSTGDITNETVCTITFTDDTNEKWTKNSCWLTCQISGSSGGLKSYYCTTTESTYTKRVVQVCSVVTADKNAQFDTGPQIWIYKEDIFS